MIYGIIGTGAVGGYYGGMLARAGHEVHFLLHGDYEYVRDNGLLIDSCNGSFRLPHVNAWRSAADMPRCDVVLVCLKTTRNSLLATLLPPLLHERTLVVLIQNGIGVETDVQAMFPDTDFAAGLAFICSAKVGPGHVSHQCYGNISIAPYGNAGTGVAGLLAEHFKAAGVGAAVVDYDTARWRKAVWNMPFNGMTVVLGTQTDRLLSCPATARLVREQMLEVTGAARALGVKGVDEAFADKMICNTQVMTPYSPSMKLDYDNGRPMEIYYLYTRPIEEARRAGFDMPRLAMLEAELKFLQP